MRDVTTSVMGKAESTKQKKQNKTCIEMWKITGL